MVSYRTHLREIKPNKLISEDKVDQLLKVIKELEDY
jgi:hypothetical protein